MPTCLRVNSGCSFLDGETEPEAAPSNKTYSYFIFTHELCAYVKLLNNTITETSYLEDCSHLKWTCQCETRVRSHPSVESYRQNASFSASSCTLA